MNGCFRIQGLAFLWIDQPKHRWEYRFVFGRRGGCGDVGADTLLLHRWNLLVCAQGVDWVVNAADACKQLRLPKFVRSELT